MKLSRSAPFHALTLAFLFNGIGIPLAATGLTHPIWAMTAMAVSVTAIFIAGTT